MNRGIARRTLFETERDIRYFLSRVARAVRASLLEVHAFCVLTTHFHLLVRTPEATLAEAMQRIQNEYTRWFNRARRRDGTLYRGRYCSRPVRTLAYRRTLVRYIDANPVAAGLVADPRLYPHGSARRYAAARGPIWLERSWIESLARERSGQLRYRPEDYASIFGGHVPPSLERLVQKRLELSADCEDPLDELLGAATGRVAHWMRRKAMIADGTRVGLPICDTESVRKVFHSVRSEEGAWSIQLARKAVDVWPQAQVVLARDLCAATFAESGVLAGVTEAGAWKLYRRHVEWMKEGGAYAFKIAGLAERVMRSESMHFFDASCRPIPAAPRTFGLGVEET